MRRERRGRRHRVYVMLDDDLPGNGKAEDSELVVARERVRELEGQVAFLDGQMHSERERYEGCMIWSIIQLLISIEIRIEVKARTKWCRAFVLGWLLLLRYSVSAPSLSILGLNSPHLSSRGTSGHRTSTPRA